MRLIHKKLFEYIRERDHQLAKLEQRVTDLEGKVAAGATTVDPEKLTLRAEKVIIP